jgi:flagellar motor protein MotB
MIVSIVVLGCVAVVGCVPYQKHRDLQEKYNQVVRTNEDLIQKLHQEMMKKSGVAAADQWAASDGSPEFQRLVAENAALRQQLEATKGRFTAEDEKYLADRGIAGISRDAEGGLILGSDLLFDSGVAALRKTQFRELDGIADLLRTRYPSEKIVIEGHTDDDPLKSTKNLFQHNWNLGYSRAQSVFEYFNTKHGLPQQQFALVTYGYMKPAVEIPLSGTPAEIAAAKSKNRRVVIRRGGATVAAR